MAISNKFLERGNPDKAFEVAKAITDNSDQNNAFMAISNKFLEKGNPDKAFEVRNEALELAL